MHRRAVTAFLSVTVLAISMVAASLTVTSVANAADSPITFVGVTSAQGAGSSLTVAAPDGTQPGDLQVAVVGVANRRAGVRAPSSWSLMMSRRSPGLRTLVFTSWSTDPATFAKSRRGVWHVARSSYRGANDIAQLRMSVHRRGTWHALPTMTPVDTDDRVVGGLVSVGRGLSTSTQTPFAARLRYSARRLAVLVEDANTGSTSPVSGVARTSHRHRTTTWAMLLTTRSDVPRHFPRPRWGDGATTPTPSTPAPSTPAPSTPAPSAPAPSTPAPTTPAPTTPAPTTPAPTTPAPTPPAPPAPPSAPVPNGPSGTWNLKFQDEFAGSSVDWSKWSDRSSAEADNGHGNKGNQQLEWNQGKNCSVSGGLLTITAKADDIRSPSGTHYDWSSCLLTTTPSYSFRYGYMETRAKFPSQKGFWPGFWTWQDDSNNRWTETDAYEYYSDNPTRLYLTQHSGSGGGCTLANFGFDPSRGFHTYGVDIEPDGTDFYVDGVRKCSAGGTSTGLTNIIINMFVYSQIQPEPGTVGTKQVDYVRAWQH